jgi:hypothetical protein
MKKRTLWLLLVTVAFYVGTVFFPNSLSAQTYNDAFQLYIKSDYKGTITILNKVVKSTFQKDELARALKLLGIAHFMQGNRKAAAKAFRFALKNDPNTQITQAEVLDEGIVDFFSDQKTAIEDEKLMKKLQEEERRLKAGGGEGNRQGKAPDDGADDFGLDQSPPPLPPQKSQEAREPKRSRPSPKVDFGSEPFMSREGGEREKSRTGKGKGRKEKSGGSSLLHILPLGIGFFADGRPLWGVAYASAQIGGVAWALMIEQNIKKAIANSDVVQDDDAYTQEEKDETYETATAYVTTQRSTQLMAFGLAGAGYGIGLIHGLAVPPSAGGGRSRAEELDAKTQPDFIAAPQPYSGDLSFALIPKMRGGRLRFDPGLNFNLYLP